MHEGKQRQGELPRGYDSPSIPPSSSPFSSKSTHPAQKHLSEIDLFQNLLRFVLSILALAVRKTINRSRASTIHSSREGRYLKGGYDSSTPLSRARQSFQYTATVLLLRCIEKYFTSTTSPYSIVLKISTITTTVLHSRCCCNRATNHLWHRRRGLWAGWDEGIPARYVSEFLARHAASGGVIVGWEVHGDLEVMGFEKVILTLTPLLCPTTSLITNNFLTTLLKANLFMILNHIQKSKQSHERAHVKMWKCLSFNKWFSQVF